MSEPKLPAISFNDLTLGYDRHPAVHHISGKVLRGDLLALVGPTVPNAAVWGLRTTINF
jgi:ABC-type multidrug transport system fused ATPase/permease subunit